MYNISHIEFDFTVLDFTVLGMFQEPYPAAEMIITFNVSPEAPETAAASSTGAVAQKESSSRAQPKIFEQPPWVSLG